MPYTIAFTDFNNKEDIFVEDLVLNQQTSLKFPGRQYSGYATAISENFLHLLENFSNNSPPQRAVEGQLWYDNTDGINQLKIYDGTTWLPSGNVKKAEEQPDNSISQPGDLWVDTNNQQLYLNSGSGWILVGPEFTGGLPTGAAPRTIIGQDNNEYKVVIVEINAEIVAILSTAEFSPKSTIPGFTRSPIKPGLNLSSNNITGSGIPKLIGTTEKAESLVVNNESVDASNFLRGDTTSTSFFPLNIRNNTGINIGTDSAISLGVEGQAGILQHQINGSNIDIRIRNQGSSKTVIRVDSSERVGINTESPDEALDVNGNIASNSQIKINSTIDSNNINSGSFITKGGAAVAKNLSVGGQSSFDQTVTLGSENLTEQTSNVLLPDTNNTRSIGSDNLRWQNIYATNFRGSLIGNVSGSISGTAGSAFKLTNGTTFRHTGDITSNEILFDGSAGGNEKIFQTTLNNSVISNKEDTAFANLSDEILINRTSGTVGLYKVSVNNLLDRIPTNPPGIIAPFAGDTAPQGWLLCDGSLYDIADFPQLSKVLQNKFTGTASVPSTQFRVPDLRGRMPLGADNMGGQSANVVQGLYADAIGATGGSETTNLTVNNLPQHEHTFRDSNNNQFYAFRNESVETDVFGAIPFTAPTGSKFDFLATSGEIDGVAEEDFEAVNNMNPTLTLNYIIYTGQG
jgi:microcystin-dependent protein